MQSVSFKLSDTTSNGWTSNGFDDFLPANRFIPVPEPKPVKLILPHKRHLVPVQQEAKRREWLKAQGLRK
jgi:hypothetical protein